MSEEHDHAYMHAHGIPHSHPHEHKGCDGAANVHDDHARDAGQGCESDPRAEIVALMRYMIGHNASHAGELSELAQRLKDSGNAAACEQVMQAVSDFEKGNARLAAVLSTLSTVQ